MINPDKVIDYYINKLNSEWQVTLRTQDGIQIVRPRRVSRLGLWSGLFLLPLWGFGFVIWILTIIDYLFQREKVVFVSVSQMVKQLKSEAK